jgi:tRNA(Met) cytidine acetyltransferase
MKNEVFVEWLQGFQQQALALNERRLIVLVGDELWAHSLLKVVDIIENSHTEKPRCFIYGDNDIIRPNVSLQRFHDKLGSESDYVIFAHSQLPIDALAALSGTLVAGGVLFLLVSDYTQLETSLFFKRFLKLVNKGDEHVVLEQKNLALPIVECTPSTNNNISTDKTTLNYACVTQEQVIAVDAIIKVVRGKRKRPLVLTADRGRGKSSALALACTELLNTAKKDNPLHIVITAADVNSLQVFFKQLQTSLPTGERQNNRFTSDNGCVEFIAVDQLIKQSPQASLVLVDEAAAIPVYLLEQLVQNHHRMVFASTVHGYEGAGRGFTLKFQQSLNLTCPHWRSLHIHQPIRYREGDPLEQLIFDACLLNAEFDDLACDFAKSSSSVWVDMNALTFKHFTSKSLSENEALLTQVVSVLVTAHYQTKPSDVRMLLDNPHVQILCLLSEVNNKQSVVAVAMLISEGHSDVEQVSSTDIIAIKHSQRRLSNHFTPQSLLTQCGVEQAFDFYYLRVMRIAVHVQLQQQGIGGYFLAKITQHAQSQGADFLASSFGATKPLLCFWLQQGYHMARLGFSKDKASGEHSALVLKPLSYKASELEFTLKHEFYRSFDYLLSDDYQWLAADLIALILHYCPKASMVQLTDHDLANVTAFIQGHRQYACCVFSLYLWLKERLINTNLAEQSDTAVLIQRIMQKQSITDVCYQHGFTGKKMLEQFLREKLKRLLCTNDNADKL